MIIQKDEISTTEVICEITSMASSENFVQFGEGGRHALRRRMNVLDEPQFKRDQSHTPIQFSLPLKVGGLGRLELPFGLFVISGGSAVGKSDFLRSLGKVIPTHRVLAVEPPDKDELTESYIYNSVDSALLHLVRDQLEGRTDLPVLDSFRESLFEINGPAGAKGIVNAFFTALTRLSNSLAFNGLTVVATVNPMNQDADYLKEFTSKLSSSVPGFMLLDSRTQVGNNITYTGRVSTRPIRKEQIFSFSTNSTVTGEYVEEVTFAAKAGKTSVDRFSSLAEKALIDRISNEQI